MNPTATLRALKGAPASLLLALLVNPGQTLGAQHLATLTAYSDKPIAAGLRTLADLGLAQNHARTNGWAATTAIRQAILGELPPETENIRLEPGGSSCSVIVEDDCLLLSTTTTTPRESEKFRLTPDWAILRDILVDDCATPRTLAMTVIHSLSTADANPRAEALDALRWLSYCQSSHGSSIQYPGAFIAAKLSHNEPCPAWYQPSYSCPLWRRIDQLASRRARRLDSSTLQKGGATFPTSSSKPW